LSSSPQTYFSASSIPTHFSPQVDGSKPKKGSSRPLKSYPSASTKYSNTLQLERKPEVIVSTNDLAASGKSLNNSSDDKDILNVTNLTKTQTSSVPNLNMIEMR